MTETRAGLPILAFADAAGFECWLATNGERAPGLWVKFAKAGSGHQSVSKAQAIDAALCHGWIDGQIDTYDATHWLVRFTPRTATSRWSEKNRDRAIELMAAGRMRPAGLAQVEAARADGRWDRAYPPASTATVPSDLQAAFAAHPAAAAFFATLTGVNRYAILHRIGAVKRAETRAKKIAGFVEMLARGETLYGPDGRPHRKR